MKYFSGYALLPDFPRLFVESAGCSDDDTQSEDEASGPGVCILPSDIAWGEVTTAQDTAAIKLSKCPWS